MSSYKRLACPLGSFGPQALRLDATMMRAEYKSIVLISDSMVCCEIEFLTLNWILRSIRIITVFWNNSTCKAVNCTWLLLVLLIPKYHSKPCYYIYKFHMTCKVFTCYVG